MASWAATIIEHLYARDILTGTSEDDRFMSSVTANLAVWDREEGARVFISLRKIHTSDLRWEGALFFRMNFLPCRESLQVASYFHVFLN